MNNALREELIPEDADIEQREMKLHKLVIGAGSQLLGKTLKQSGIRDNYNCMVVGVEEGQQNLTIINPSHRFEVGDIVWVVGEEHNVERLGKKG